MKFLSLFAAGALASSLATPVEKRQSGAEIASAALQSIIAANTLLSDTIDSFDPTSQDSISALQGAATGLFTSISTGADNIANAGPISDSEAIGLAPLAGQLTSGTTTTVDKTINAKPQIANPPACLGTITFFLLSELRPEAARLAANLRSKVSATFQGVIDGVAASIDADLARGQAAYADQETVPCNCDSSCTSTTTTTTTTSSTTTTTGGTTTTTTTGGTTTTTTTSGTATSTTTTTGGTGTTTSTTSGTTGGTTGPTTSQPPTTGGPTSGKPTTGVPTSGKPTSGVPTSGVPTSGQPGKPSSSAGQPGSPSSTTPGKPYTTSKSPIATYTGAAAQVVANFGAVAAAAFAILL